MPYGSFYYLYVVFLKDMDVECSPVKQKQKRIDNYMNGCTTGNVKMKGENFVECYA